MERKHGRAAGCLTILAAVVIVGLLDRPWSNKPNLEPAPAPPAQTPAEQAAQTEKETASALANPRYAIGQEFSVGYFSYRVNRVEVKYINTTIYPVKSQS
jgi:hypothetical protein